MVHNPSFDPNKASGELPGAIIDWADHFSGAVEQHISGEGLFDHFVHMLDEFEPATGDEACGQGHHLHFQ